MSQDTPPPGPAPGPGHVLVPLPRQDSAPAVVCAVAAAPTPGPSLAAPALGPRTAPLSGPVQRPEIGRKRGLKIALITEGPKGVRGGRLLSGSWALPQPAQDPAQALGKGPHPGPPVPSPLLVSQWDRE